ncbi:MAG: hypothetical protein KKF46_07225 [Nanoarchaeota archaeon]|nr:hypothetical protein [Nanoarchaeota archaeon]MBU1322119.1 hypothetical protein [Nanoarchaeota archaeon]MBU2442275.1 hypothetical protein [Nanoarchaeota archaeon]
MGSIISSRREDEKVIIETELNYEELVQLKGEIDNIHVFSEKIADLKTNISRRGKNEATKYFLIPRSLRKDLQIYEPVSCQRIDTPSKAIFIYVVNKNDFQEIKKIKHTVNLAREKEIEA